MTNLYEVDILINGRPIKQYNYPKGGRCVEGKGNSSFSLRFKNNSSNRALFSTVIDGLSILTGNIARPHSSDGYVVEPNSSIIVDGWRLSFDEVAEFYFSCLNDAYSNRINAPRKNIGIIHTRVYPEFVLPDINNFQEMFFKSTDVAKDVSYQTCGQLTNRDTTDRVDTNITTQANYQYSVSPNTKQELGTGFGSTKKSSVVDACHIWQQFPALDLTIHYNSRRGLREAGVNFNTNGSIYRSSNSTDYFCRRPQHRQRNRR